MRLVQAVEPEASAEHVGGATEILVSVACKNSDRTSATFCHGNGFTEKIPF